MKEITLTVTVTVPNDTDNGEVEEAINRALNEPPQDWDDWTVGAAIIVGRCQRSHGGADGPFCTNVATHLVPDTHGGADYRTCSRCIWLWPNGNQARRIAHV